jgi:hypothetical protein
VCRPVDEPIPADEQLYRGLLPDWIKGKTVLPDAIDLQGSSVNRHKYNPDPRAAMLRARGHTDVASITPGRLPGQIDLPSGLSYFFRADDLPLADNPAHAEIRPCRVSKGWDRNHKVSAGNRLRLKQELADRMELLPSKSAEDES